MTPIKKRVQHLQHRKVYNRRFFDVLIQQGLHVGDGHGLHHIPEDNIESDVVDEVSVNDFERFSDLRFFNNIIRAHT